MNPCWKPACSSQSAHGIFAEEHLIGQCKREGAQKTSRKKSKQEVALHLEMLSWSPFCCLTSSFSRSQARLTNLRIGLRLNRCPWKIVSATQLSLSDHALLRAYNSLYSNRSWLEGAHRNQAFICKRAVIKCSSPTCPLEEASTLLRQANHLFLVSANRILNTKTQQKRDGAAPTCSDPQHCGICCVRKKVQSTVATPHKTNSSLFSPGHLKNRSTLPWRSPSRRPWVGAWEVDLSGEHESMSCPKWVEAAGQNHVAQVWCKRWVEPTAIASIWLKKTTVAQTQKQRDAKETTTHTHTHTSSKQPKVEATSSKSPSWDWNLFGFWPERRHMDWVLEKLHAHWLWSHLPQLALQLLRPPWRKRSHEFLVERKALFLSAKLLTRPTSHERTRSAPAESSARS